MQALWSRAEFLDEPLSESACKAALDSVGSSAALFFVRCGSSGLVDVDSIDP
jgi:hypothetical protein